MSLTLVTGPANAAKAGAVLDPLRARLDERPLLVVPAFPDIEHSRRELAETGATFGARAVHSNGLFELIAERVGYRGRRASELQRTLVAEDAVRRAELEVMAESATRPGFVRALVRFAGEMERSLVEPPRLIAGLRAWAQDGPRAAYAEEVGRVYRCYREALERAGLVDEDLFAAEALRALERAPAAWGATPLFVYGFDDFTEVEMSTLLLLARHVDVTISLPYEHGHGAFRATSAIYQRLRPEAAVEEEQRASDSYYAPASRTALNKLERGLFNTGGAARKSGGAVRLHTAGGERAEVELAGARVLQLLRDGTPPGQIAVVFREPADYASLVEQVFGAYEIPYSGDCQVPLAHTGLGRGLLALLRAACLDGSADDLLAYLRTPGLLDLPHLADALEAAVRREGDTTAAAARALWEDDRWELGEIDRLAAADSAAALLAELQRRVRTLFARPRRRAAPILEGAETDDARSFRAADRALGELRRLVEADPSIALDAAELHHILETLPVRAGESEQPDRVQVASPLDIRARRFEAVLICGLQEGEFPRGAPPDAFLSDTDRREINRAAGRFLPLREDQLDRERYLFYVAASRAEAELTLSWRTSDEDGNPRARSALVDEVERLFTDLDKHTSTRSLADVTWPADEAPTEAEWERAVAKASPRRTAPPVASLTVPAARDRVRAKEALSASALERYAGCPVKWLVEDLLQPEKLEPDPEQMVRGSYAHKVLEITLRRLHEKLGTRRLSPENLAVAEEILLTAMREQQGEFRVSPDQTRVRAAVRRLEFDLLRHLRYEAEADGVFEPEHLELRFGFADSDHPAVDVAGGVRVRGVIDRVDTWNGHALVRDYKSGKVETYKASDWERLRRFQAALYMLVTERVLGLKPAGGVYVPLGGSKRRPRGMVAEELAEEIGSGFVRNDVRPEDDFAAVIDWAQDQIATVAGLMGEGELRSCPDTCAYRGGCEHPSICRVEA